MTTVTFRRGWLRHDKLSAGRRQGVVVRFSFNQVVNVFKFDFSRSHDEFGRGGSHRRTLFVLQFTAIGDNNPDSRSPNW